jgi:hypothetical protein
LHDLIERLRNAGKLEPQREPGKWTPQQIVVHLADVEAVQTVRVMAMLALGKPVMLGFNADEWAAAGCYASRDTHQSLRTLTALRERNLELWCTLTPAHLARLGAHPTRGEFTVEAWLGFVARHDAKHLAHPEQGLS